MTENEQIQEMAKDVCVNCMSEVCASGQCAFQYDCPLSIETIKKLYSNGYRKVERGEWELNIDGSHWCSECGHNATYTYDGTEVCGVSCPFCGADMRGENNEQHSKISKEAR